MIKISVKLAVNVISLHTNCVKREFHERQFSLSIMILGEKLVNFGMISHELAKIA